MKRQIVFLEPFPEVMTYKMAKMFKQKGDETVSIRILESKDLALTNFYNRAFDEVKSFDLNFFRMDMKNLPLIFLSLLKKMKKIVQTSIFVLKLKPHVIIVRAKPSWPCALFRIIFKKNPLIYFPYDIRSESHSSRKIAEQNGLKSFEIDSEKFCFENADGILHKGAPDELKFLEGRIFEKINFTPLQMMFLPYCSDEFITPINKNKLSKKDGEIHIVQVSSVSSADLGECSFLFDYFKEFTKNKIHLHLYTKPNTLSKEEIINSFKKTYKKEIDSKYFHLHDPKNPKELIKEISKFDFGVVITHPYTRTDDPLEAKVGLGNKVSSYLEAGIPFFYPPETEFIDKIMSGYGLRLSLKDEKEIKKIKNMIKKLNYAALENKIKIARKDFSMEKHFPELEKFIEEVVNRKRQIK
jgi:hypothetical protein